MSRHGGRHVEAFFLNKGEELAGSTTSRRVLLCARDAFGLRGLLPAHLLRQKLNQSGGVGHDGGREPLNILHFLFGSEISLLHFGIRTNTRRHIAGHYVAGEQNSNAVGKREHYIHVVLDKQDCQLPL